MIIYFYNSKELIANLIKKILISINPEDSSIILFKKSNPIKRNHTQNTRMDKKLIRKASKKSGSILTKRNKNKKEDLSES